MKKHLLTFSIVCSSLATNVWADQQLGAQVYTRQPFGYGKLVMELMPSTEPGIVNGFFMLKYFKSKSEDASYPNGWTEADYEYVPGNKLSDRRTAEGDCGQPNGNCKTGVLDGQSAADFLSVNIIGGPLTGDAAADSQVFYKISKNYFTQSNFYNVEYTPSQIKWGAKNVNQDRPYMYQKSGQDNRDIHQSLGMQYLVNRNMYIWLNIYSGLGQGWGGPVIPKTNTQMIVRTVAFYPATSCDANGCNYSSTPSMYSDFVNDRYTMNGASATFDQVWVNKDSLNYPIFTRAANAYIHRGSGLVMRYVYTP